MDAISEILKRTKGIVPNEFTDNRIVYKMEGDISITFLGYVDNKESVGCIIDKEDGSIVDIFSCSIDEAIEFIKDDCK